MDRSSEETMKAHSFALSKNAGFTLIEVLIAMVILAIGLLGLAGLQATGIKNNLSAYHRSQATQLAYDIADRMRANAGAAASYPTAVATANGNCLTTTGCLAPAMAKNDLFEWNQNIVALLPSGQGSITSSGPITAPIYKITINWDDNRDGCLNTAGTTPIAGCTGKPNDPNFTMSFQL